MVLCKLQLYRACGYTFLCYPLLLEVSDFYLSQDMEFVIDEVRVSCLGCWVNAMVTCEMKLFQNNYVRFSVACVCLVSF